MPYPSIVGSATSGRDSDAIDDSVTLPASIASGDLILVFHFAGGDDTRTFPSPWVEIKDETSNIPNTFGATIGVAYLIASGGETSVLVTKSAAERFNAIAIRISAASWHGTTPPEISTGVKAGSSTPNPDSLTASWGSANNLWVAIQLLSSPELSLPVISFPTNYTGTRISIGAGTSSNGGGSIATIASDVGTENPGNFTNSASDQHWAGTLVVRGTATAAGPEEIISLGIGSPASIPFFLLLGLNAAAAAASPVLQDLAHTPLHQAIISM